MTDKPSNARRWFAEMKRRKVFRVAAVYLIGAWALIQIADTTFETMGLPPWTVKLVIVLVILGFPLVCALAWAFDVTPAGIERTAPADPEPASAAVETAGTPEKPAIKGQADTPAPPQAVAILPFRDMSPERDQEYFCEGIAEEIINSLCLVRGLRVASRTSSFYFRDRSEDVRNIGRQLGVSAVLEGSVRKAGETVRISVQLVNCADGYHIWAQNYDRQLKDVFVIQTEIAQRLVDAMRVTLTERESELIQRGGTGNARAYDFFLRGQQELRFHNVGGNAALWFRRAIEEDPGFAQAHAGLATALATRGLWRVDMTESDFEDAFTASRRALELEPWMPEAHLARACLASMQGRAADAQRDFDEAIRLNPSSYYAYYLRGRHYLDEGEDELALEQFRISADLAPEEYTPLGMLASALQRLGRWEEVLEAARKALPVVKRHLEVHPDDDVAMSRAATFAAWLGEEAEAIELAEGAMRLRPGGHASLYNAACVYANLGHHERALELLDEAVADGRGNLVWFEQDEDLAALRSYPRFQEILERLRVASGDDSGSAS